MKTLRGRRDWGQVVKKGESGNFGVTFVVSFLCAQPLVIHRMLVTTTILPWGISIHLSVQPDNAFLPIPHTRHLD